MFYLDEYHSLYFFHCISYITAQRVFSKLFLQGKNLLKYLKIYINTDLKIILLNHQNNIEKKSGYIN